ncbi:MAG TPA: polysaccharide deacetylase family protein [Blastocatellia bacterium]|nr:polysaccharide deacetylase family protein [Blastocatellia bacterium]
MNKSALNLLRITGAFAPFRWAHRSQALILTYHRFSEREGEGAISARAFAEQVKYLAAHYTILPLSQLAVCLQKREIPPSLAAITIDDGYRDAYEIAFPILRKHCAPATVFVVTEFVEGTAWLWTDKSRYLTAFAAPQAIEIGVKGHRLRLELKGDASRAVAAGLINAALKPLSEEVRDATIERLAFDLKVKPPERPPVEYGAMNWRQAREMVDSGVEFGSHTLTHPILTGLSDDRLREEVSQSRDRIQSALGRKVETFCYPNGDYDPRAQFEVARAGYQCAVTTEVGLNNRGSDPLALRRIHSEYDLARFVKNTSGFDTWRRTKLSA